MKHFRYRINCDGLLDDGTPCQEVAEGDLSPGAEIPVPDGWIHEQGTLTAVSGGSQQDQAMDFFFHSRACEQRHHDGPLAQFLQNAGVS